MGYIPKSWKEKYKGVLGNYKKFIQEHPDKFAIVEHDAFNFTILKAGEELTKGKKPKVKVKMPWAKTLLKAFMEWCKVTPKSERRFADFMAEIPTDKEPTTGPGNSSSGEKQTDERLSTQKEMKKRPAPEGEKPAKK